MDPAVKPDAEIGRRHGDTETRRREETSPLSASQSLRVFPLPVSPSPPLRVSQSSFLAITSEGGLLPADFLAELLAPKSAIEGLTPVSYNLAEGERINEQVNRSWNRLRGRWVDFKKAIAQKQPGGANRSETRYKQSGRR